MSLQCLRMKNQMSVIDDQLGDNPGSLLRKVGVVPVDVRGNIGASGCTQLAVEIRSQFIKVNKVGLEFGR